MSAAPIPFSAPPGGVMTVPEGAVSGDLELWLTARPDGETRVEVSYAGAADRYEVEGSPAPAGIVAEAIVTWLSRDPGVDADDNPIATDLTGI